MAPTKWLEGLQKIIFRGLGGAIGVILRYLIWNHFETTNPSNTYWTSVIVNIVGAFVAGFTVYLFFRSVSLRKKWINSLRYGVIGGFTTFNWFIYDFYSLLQADQLTQAGIYFGITFVLCIIMYEVGLRIGERISKPLSKDKKTGKDQREIPWTGEGPREIPWTGESY